MQATIYDLKQQLDELVARNEDYQLKFDAIVKFGQDYNVVLGSEHSFQNYVADVKKVQEQLALEAAMPAHVKEEIAKSNQYHYVTRCKLSKRDQQLTEALAKIQELESRLGIKPVKKSAAVSIKKPKD